MTDAAPRLSAEQVYLNAIQINAGQFAIWTALASALVFNKTVDIERLFTEIAFQRSKIPAPQDGPLARAVTDEAMKDILKHQYGGVEKSPDWALKVLSGELVPVVIGEGKAD